MKNFRLMHKILLAPVVVIFTLAPALAGTHDGSVVAGEVSPDGAGEGFISMGATRALDINPAFVAMGDRLGVYVRENKKHAGGHGALVKAGEFVVTSRSGEAPAGELSRMTREIFGPAYLKFELGEEEQLNRYLPFIQNIGDTFLPPAAEGKLTVAPLDVVNRFGDRTSGGDIIFADFRKHICARAQFECVDGEKIGKALAANGALTSRGMDDQATRSVAALLGADVFISGHVIESEKGVEFIALAEKADASSAPRRLWRRFVFSPEELGVSTASLKEITVSYKKARRGGLKLRAREAGPVDGMKVDKFAYIDLSKLTIGKGIRAASVGQFFLAFDGKDLNPGAQGVFYDGMMDAGTHKLTFGYYPVLWEKGGANKMAQSPVQETMEITIVENENLEVDVIGSVESGFAIIAADTRYGGY